MKACYSIPLDRNFSKFIFLLEDIGVNPELVEYEDVDIESSDFHWKRKLGTLELENSDIQLVEVVESGYGDIKVVQSSHTTHSGGMSGSSPPFRSSTARNSNNLLFLRR